MWWGSWEVYLHDRSGGGRHRTLGRNLVAELQRRGERVRALARDRNRVTLLEPAPTEIAIADLVDWSSDVDGACRGVRSVMSVAGQSCSTRRLPERGSFRAVDYAGNRRLLEAAVKAGAERFLYVSVLGAQRLRGLEYIDAHEEFVELLQSSPIESTVVRANGFFAGYLEMLDLVTSRGPAPVIGSGEAKDNPIHEADLAVACLESLESGEREVEVGGPEVLTRRQELELVCEVVRGRPRIVRVPPRVVNATAALLRPFDVRRAEVIKFVAAICVTDMVGPTTGHRRLSDYLSTAVGDADA